MHLLQKEGAHEPLLCLLPHCPLDLLSSLTLPSCPSSLSCSLPQFFLVSFSLSLFTVVSPCLSPLLSIFLHLSLSYPQSSRLSIAPLRSPWSKYFTGIEIDPELSIFKWSKVLDLRTAKGGRNGPAQ